ncbi:MAG TPA: SCO family protein [Xanthobacteraceae bacterium]|jgi:protein SCO1/2|nr:SCO family protein [Xanthobacteraceae bacterium]
MKARTAQILLMLVGFLAGVASIVLIVVVVSGRDPVPSAGASAIGGPFSLVDQNGQTVTDKDLRGRPFLVFFGFTHCPDVCPTALFEISEVLGKLGPDAQKVSALFVTIDPERDTPAQMKDYLSSFNPRLVGLTGDPAAIAAVAREYRVYVKKVPLDNGEYTMDHTALVYLMDKDGSFVAPFNLKRSAEDAAADLRRHL